MLPANLELSAMDFALVNAMSRETTLTFRQLGEVKWEKNINNNTEQIIGDTDTASLEEIKTISKYLEDIGAKNPELEKLREKRDDQLKNLPQK